jgi:hypothetical protein
MRLQYTLFERVRKPTCLRKRFHGSIEFRESNRTSWFPAFGGWHKRRFALTDLKEAG